MIYKLMYIYIYCMYMYLCMYVSMYLYMYVSMYLWMGGKPPYHMGWGGVNICIYICICTYIWRHVLGRSWEGA